MKHVFITPSCYDELIEKGWNADKVIDTIDAHFPHNESAYDFDVSIYYVYFRVDGVEYCMNNNYEIKEDEYAKR